MDIIFDVHRGFFGLKKELALAANTKRIIRGSCGPAHLDSILMDNIFIGFCKALLVIYVPSQGLEEGINKFPSDLGFIVVTGFVGLYIAYEPLHQIHYLFRCGQIRSPSELPISCPQEKALDH